MLKRTCSCSLFYLLCFLSHAISKKGGEKRRRKEKDTTKSLFLSEGCLHEKRFCIFHSNVKFNSVFYRCTNCLANSVLYSRDHKQGFILYCISTHWTIIRIRDCKENDIESVGRENPNTFASYSRRSCGSEEKYFPGETADYVSYLVHIWTCRFG